MAIRRVRPVGAVVALAAAALVLAGCGGGDDSGGGDLSVDGEFDPRAWEGTTLRVLRHSGYDADVMQDLFADFTAETGIEVEMEQVPFSNLRTKQVTELSTGTATYDLMAVPDYWLAEYAGAEWVRDLDPLMDGTATSQPDFDLEDINPRLLEANQVDGAQFALPWKFNTGLIAYRTDVFDAAPTTYEDWLAGAPAAEAAGLDLVGLSLGAASVSELYLGLLNSQGGSFLTEDDSAAAFNSPEGLEALEFLVELAGHSASGAINRAWDESAQLLAGGVTASDILLSSVAATANTGAAEGKVGYTQIVPAETSSALVNTWGLMIPSASANPEAAYQLLQFLLSTDSVRTMAEGGGGSVVPARDSLLTELTSTFPSFEAQQAAAGTASFSPQIPALDAVRKALAAPLQEAILGDIDPAEALAKAEEAVNAELGT